MIQPKMTILFQGDSITDSGRKKDFADAPIPANNFAALGGGYVANISRRLLADFPTFGLQFHNRGISGNRVTNMRDRWRTDCLDIKPDLLSILIGVNDTWHGVAKGTPENGVGVAAFDAVLRKLIADTRAALPKAKIVLCEPFTTETGAVLQLKFHPDIDERRAVVRGIGADLADTFVPFQKLFDDLCTRAPAGYWADDGVHPTAAGHEMMARFWIEHVCGNGARQAVSGVGVRRAAAGGL